MMIAFKIGVQHQNWYMTSKMSVPSTPFSRSMRDLPPELAAAMLAPSGPLPKRERTRRQLLAAAVQVFSERGIVEGTIQEIAQIAGTATTTVYNHFKTREEVVHEVAAWLAETLCLAIATSYDHVGQAAERMSIGNRRYIWLAEQSPAWALLLLNVMDAAPRQVLRILQYPLADLRLGVGQKAFRITSEAAAMDLIGGTVAQGMRSVSLGAGIPEGHGIAIATTVLRGLGVPFEKAAQVARRPLPGFATPPLGR
jgi:AcrR family transcriptional regulator